MGRFYTYYLSLYKAFVRLNETEIIRINDKKGNANDNEKGNGETFQTFNST